MEPSYKERLFVSYYLGVSKGNATDAAARAGYGSTRASAKVLGHRLLTKVHIAHAINAKLDAVAMRSDEVLARISDIASASLGDFLEIDEKSARISLQKGRRRGRLHTLRKFKDGAAGAEIEIKDSFPALKLMGEYHGVFKNPIGDVKPDDAKAQDDTGNPIEP